MLARLVAAVALAAALLAQQPAAVPLRCQVVDAANAPRPGLHVSGTLRTSGAEPVRVEAVTCGADGIAAVVFFASGATPTTGATLPVDAGIPGAFPR